MSPHADTLSSLSKETSRQVSIGDFTGKELSNVPEFDPSNDSKEGYLASLLALKHSENFVQTSKSYSAKYENALPKLQSSEVEIGSFLGKGGFSDVFEIKSFPLLESNEAEDEDQHTAREFLKIHCFRETSGVCRYAIKYLRQDIIANNEIFPMAAMDLALEAKILCSVFHPNIIKLRGVCLEGEMGFRTGKPDGFFLVLDRLDETLDQRINKWKEEGLNAPKKSSSGFPLKKLLGKKKSPVEEIPEDRLKIFRDVASALLYVHQRKIVYRDVKPENFGFDVRGDIKLFDFGLSKEISSSEKLSDGTYKLTGGIGSLRYMAPEVIKFETYNLSADVYSFAIMLWEMLTQSKPYEGFNAEQHAKLVAHGTYRLKISKSYPLPIQKMLADGWSSNLHDRPSFENIFDTFSEMIKESKPSTMNFMRRSTYKMLRQSQIKELVSFSSAQ